MLKKFRNKSRSVRYNWIVSYIFILLIAVITETFIYFFNTNVIEDEINSSNELVIGKLKDNVDGMLSDVEQFSNAVVANQNIQRVLSISDSPDGESYYRLYSLTQELYNYRILSKYMENYYIYFNNLDMVITQGTAYKTEDCFNFYFRANGAKFGQWLDIMKKQYKGEYVLMPIHNEVTGDKEAVGFIRTIAYPDLNRPYANLIVLLDFNELIKNNISKSDNFRERQLLILGQDGQPIAGDENIKSGLDYGRLKGDQGKISQMVNGEKVVVSYTTSQVNGWKYITVTPENVFWSQLRFTRNIMLGSLIFCIIFGSYLSYFFMRKNYNPLSDVVSFFHSRIKLEDSGKISGRINEYNFLQGAFEETLQQKAAINSKLQKQNNALKYNFISDLLKGRNMALPINELMAAYGIMFKYGSFTAVAIYIENIEEGFWNESDGNKTDNYSLCRFVIKNVVEELVNRNCYGFITEVDDMLVCLVNMEADGINYKNELKDIINSAKEFLKRYFKITMEFSVGGLHKTLKGIQEAFKEAVNAMEYLKIMGLDYVVFYDEIPQIGEKQYYYPVEKEYQLINFIKSADYSGAIGILEEIFRENFINSKPALEITRYITFDLVSTLLKTANEIEKLDDTDFMEKINIVNNLIKCKSYMEIKNEIFKILEGICDYISKNTDNNDCRIKDMMINIISENYNDPNLGIASISEQIGKYPYYISRIFKEQTGEGVMEYINRMRINKAKELLKENVLNQEEIAQKVGYTSVRTFYRTFKKQEGITPGKSKICSDIVNMSHTE